MYSVEIAYEENGRIRKDIFKKDLINEALSEVRLRVNGMIPKGKIVAIIVLRED